MQKDQIRILFLSMYSMLSLLGSKGLCSDGAFARYYFDNACGLNAVFIASTLAGENVVYSDLKTYLDVDIPNVGLSISQLELLLDVAGADYVSVKFNLERFSQSNEGVGIFWKGSAEENRNLGHFFVLYKNADGNVVMIDPPNNNRIVSFEPGMCDDLRPAILLSRTGDFSEYSPFFESFTY